MPGLSSKAYVHTGKNEDNIELRGVNTEHSKKEAGPEESHERDIEESISLKQTKPEPLGSKKNEGKSSNEGDAKEKKNPFAKKLTYINATNPELKELGYSDWRISFASFMRTKLVDITIITCIILYSLLVVVFLAIDDEIEDNEDLKLSLQIVELVFLFIFCIEISLNLVGFG